MASCNSIRAEGGSRTNRFSTCSQCALLGSSFLWLSITHACVFRLCFGVATLFATCFFMVVLFIALLHGLASALLHERIFSRYTVQVILMEENRGSGSSQTENNVEDWLQSLSNCCC